MGTHMGGKDNPKSRAAVSRSPEPDIPGLLSLWMRHWESQEWSVQLAYPSVAGLVILLYTSRTSGQIIIWHLRPSGGHKSMCLAITLLAKDKT